MNINYMVLQSLYDGLQKYLFLSNTERAAPELLKDEIATSKSDVWSFAIVDHNLIIIYFWQVVNEILENGEVPYSFLEKNVEVSEYVLAGKRLPSCQDCSAELYKLMLTCWETKAENRYGCSDIGD